MEGIVEDIFCGCPEIFLKVKQLPPGSPAPLPALSPSLRVLMGRCLYKSSVDKCLFLFRFQDIKLFEMLTTIWIFQELPYWLWPDFWDLVVDCWGGSRGFKENSNFILQLASALHCEEVSKKLLILFYNWLQNNVHQDFNFQTSRFCRTLTAATRRYLQYLR